MRSVACEAWPLKRLKQVHKIKILGFVMRETTLASGEEALPHRPARGCDLEAGGFAG